MFRTFSGFRAQFHDLTLVVVSEFNEWKVLVYAPGVTIHGKPNFSEEKAKESALMMAWTYLHDQKHEDIPAPAGVEWSPSGPDEWLAWRN